MLNLIKSKGVIVSFVLLIFVLVVLKLFVIVFPTKALVVFSSVIVFLVVFVNYINQKAREKNQSFKAFSCAYTNFLVFYAFALGLGSYYQINSYVFLLIIILAVFAFFKLLTFPYVKGLSILKTKKTHIDTLRAIAVLSFQIIVPIFGAFVALFIIFRYVVPNTAVEILFLVIYFVCCSIVFIYPVILTLLKKKVLNLYTNRKKSLFFFGQSITRLLVFYKTHTKAHKNIYVLWLSSWTLFASLPFFLPIYALISCRFDSGQSFSIAMYLLFFTAFIVSFPGSQSYFGNTFGAKSLRILRWNIWGQICIECVKVGGPILVVGVLGTEGVKLYQDWSASERYKRQTDLHTTHINYTDNLRLRDPANAHNYKYGPAPEPVYYKSYFYKKNINVDVSVNPTINIGGKGKGPIGPKKSN